MEATRQYKLIFSDGIVIVDASFIEAKSKVVQSMMKDVQSTELLVSLDLSQFSKRDWEDYCVGSNDLRLFHLIDYLHLETSGLVETITEQLEEEVIRERIKKLSLDELTGFLPFLTELSLSYGERTLNIVLDVLNRSDEILETSRSYLQSPIPDNFNERLATFLEGVDWRPSPGVILSGGALMTLLSDRDLSKIDPSEDLDLFIYGPDEKIKKKLQTDLILQLTKNKKVKGVWDHLGRKITLTYQDRGRSIQIIRSEYSVPSQIPSFFDLDHLKGYLSADGLFLHPKFIRALKINHVSIDLETIKLRRVMKCLRHDYMTGREVPLWKAIVKILQSGLQNPLLGRIRHRPTEYSLGRLRGKLEKEIKSKEELITFLNEFSDPWVDQVEVQRSEPEGIPDNCRWWIERPPKDSYPYSIREKALIVALEDPVEVHQALLEKIKKLKLFDCFTDAYRNNIYLTSQPIVLRFRGLIIREHSGNYFCTFAKTDSSREGDNPRFEFLEEISRTLGEAIKPYHTEHPVPLLRDRESKNAMNLPLDLLELTGLTRHMRVDLDLQIGGLMVISKRMRVFKTHVIYMKILEHLQ